MREPLILSLAAVVAAAGLAFANDDGADRLQAPQPLWLSASLGRADLAGRWHQEPAINVDEKACELAAPSFPGARIEGRVHPVTGEISPHGFLCCRPCVAARINVPQPQWLSASEITRKLAVQGYEVHKIEVDDGAYEFEATISAGARIVAHAHPATGEVLPRDVLCCDRCLEV